MEDRAEQFHEFYVGLCVLANVEYVFLERTLREGSACTREGLQGGFGEWRVTREGLATVSLVCI